MYETDYENHPLEDDFSDIENSLCDYIAIFTRNKRIISGDRRLLLYRGQPNIKFDVRPSIFRSNLLSKEYKMINELLLSMPNEFVNVSGHFECLVKMQHYGLPTRLLDVTTNPLVALYFACIKDKENDGEILVLCENMEHPDSLDVKRISALANFNGSTENQMVSFLQKINLLPKDKEAQVISTELKNTRSRKYIAVATPMNNERIKRQQGAFLIAGMPEIEGRNPFEKNPFDIKPLLSKVEDDGLKWSIPVPKERKVILLQELDAVGINRGFLFPELEHQATFIRDKYIN